MIQQHPNIPHLISIYETTTATMTERTRNTLQVKSDGAELDRTTVPEAVVVVPDPDGGTASSLLFSSHLSTSLE